MDLSNEPTTYSFDPTDPYEAYQERRKRKVYVKRDKPSHNWRAPEHMKMTSDMERDFPRDDFGRPLEGSKRDRLVLDPRPKIMVPDRPTYKAF